MLTLRPLDVDWLDCNHHNYEVINAILGTRGGVWALVQRPANRSAFKTRKVSFIRHRRATNPHQRSDKRALQADIFSDGIVGDNRQGVAAAKVSRHTHDGPWRVLRPARRIAEEEARTNIDRLRGGCTVLHGDAYESVQRITLGILDGRFKKAVVIRDPGVDQLKHPDTPTSLVLPVRPPPILLHKGALAARVPMRGAEITLVGVVSQKK